MVEENKEKITFILEWGVYAYNVTPFCNDHYFLNCDFIYMHFYRLCLGYLIGIQYMIY